MHFPAMPHGPTSHAVPWFLSHSDSLYLDLWPTNHLCPAQWPGSKRKARELHSCGACASNCIPFQRNPCEKISSCCSMVQQFLAHNVILQSPWAHFTPRHWGSRRMQVWLKLFRSLAQGNISSSNKIVWSKAKQASSPSLRTLQYSVVLHVSPKKSSSS